jgi:hypothetical protein
MDYTEFEQKLFRWPLIRFTQVTCVQRGDATDLYATGEQTPTDICLFLCRAESASHADELARRLSAWLPRVNRKRKQRQQAGLTGDG